MSEKNPGGFEEVKVGGSQLVEKVREIIRQGDARRVIIKKDDHVYLEIPLKYGIGGAMAAIWLAPTLAAVGAVAALVTDVELVIETRQTDADAAPVKTAFGVKSSDDLDLESGERSAR